MQTQTPPLPIKFLFMDERYDEPTVRPSVTATSLTGVLARPEYHPDLRRQYYQLLARILGDDETKISASLPVVHAAKMFPELGSNDVGRFLFLEGLVRIVCDFDLRLYRVGYFNTPELTKSMKPRQVVGFCFFNLMRVIKSELDKAQIWPVMETDNSREQDDAFSGFTRRIDYQTTVLPPDWMTIDNGNLGETLYSTKNSVYGTITDFAAYLLNIRELERNGLQLTPFKRRLFEIATPLYDVVNFDQVIDLTIDS
jgi:hypothetical protein